MNHVCLHRHGTKYRWASSKSNTLCREENKGHMIRNVCQKKPMHLLPSLIKKKKKTFQRSNQKLSFCIFFHSLYCVCNCYTLESQSITFILARVQWQAQVHCSLRKPPSQSHGPTSLVGYYVSLGCVYERFGYQ